MINVKKITAVCLAVLMLMTVFPVIVFAADSGSCGYDVNWHMENGDTLIISGSGDMFDYEYSYNPAPWSEFKDEIRTVVIEDSVTAIGNYTFYECSRLNNAIIGNSVRTIGEYAFESCYNLSNLVFGENVEEIGEFSFSGCDSLHAVEFNSRLTTISDYAFSLCYELPEVNLPESLKTLGKEAFSGCFNLTRAYIPAGVVDIGKTPFKSCDRLVMITVDGNNQNYCSEDGALFNKDKTVLMQYPYGKEAESYVVPDSVRTIDEGVFYRSKLKNIVLPDGMTTIKNNTFLLCRNLESITIPASMTTINIGAFNGSENIKEVFYKGSEEDWSKINIGSLNGTLTSAKIYYNYYEHEHEYERSITTAPTCTAEGVATYTCTVCGKSYTETIARAHNYSSSVTTAPTCVAEGLMTYTCADCGDTYTEVIPATGIHTESDWIVDSESTCMAEGSKHIECTVCHEVLKTEAIPATGHDYTSVVTKEPTDTEEGERTYTCTHCGDTYIEVIPVMEAPDDGGHTDSECNCVFCQVFRFIMKLWVKIVGLFYKIFL